MEAQIKEVSLSDTGVPADGPVKRIIIGVPSRFKTAPLVLSLKYGGESYDEGTGWEEIAADILPGEVLDIEIPLNVQFYMTRWEERQGN